MSDSVTLYQQVGMAPTAFQPVDVISYTPQIGDADRERGEIIRYFCRPTHHTSPNSIVEIDRATFTKLLKNSFYTTVELRWIIRGRVRDILGLTTTNSPNRLYTGVETANRLSVDVANQTLPGIKSVIRDYIKFWQGE